MTKGLPTPPLSPSFRCRQWDTTYVEHYVGGALVHLRRFSGIGNIKRDYYFESENTGDLLCTNDIPFLCFLFYL